MTAEELHYLLSVYNSKETKEYNGEIKDKAWINGYVDWRRKGELIAGKGRTLIEDILKFVNERKERPVGTPGDITEEFSVFMLLPY